MTFVEFGLPEAIALLVFVRLFNPIIIIGDRLGLKHNLVLTKIVAIPPALCCGKVEPDQVGEGVPINC